MKGMFFGCGDEETDFVNALNFLTKVKINNKLVLEEDAMYERKLVEALLFLLHQCGDYEVQKSVVEALIAFPDVRDFEDWFSAVWFSSDQTRKLFSHLLLNDHAEARDIRKFLLSVNSDAQTQYVVSLHCLSASWNLYSLQPPAFEDLLWLDVNAGSKSLTLCVNELPPGYGESLLLPRKLRSVCIEVEGVYYQDAIVHPVKLKGTDNLRELEVITTQGSLIILVDIVENQIAWNHLSGILSYISSDQMRTPVTRPCNSNAKKTNEDIIVKSIGKTCKRLNSVLHTLGVPAPAYISRYKGHTVDSGYLPCDQEQSSNQKVSEISNVSFTRGGHPTLFPPVYSAGSNKEQPYDKELLTHIDNAAQGKQLLFSMETCSDKPVERDVKMEDPGTAVSATKRSATTSVKCEAPRDFSGVQITGFQKLLVTNPYALVEQKTNSHSNLKPFLNNPLIYCDDNNNSRVKTSNPESHGVSHMQCFEEGAPFDPSKIQSLDSYQDIEKLLSDCCLVSNSIQMDLKLQNGVSETRKKRKIRDELFCPPSLDDSSSSIDSTFSSAILMPMGQEQKKEESVSFS